MSDSNTAIPIDVHETPTMILDLLYTLKIKDVMNNKIFTALKTDSLRSIQHLMKERRITGVPIAEGKRLLGIVSMDDIISALDLGYIDAAAQEHMSTNLTVLEEDMPISFAISYFEKYAYHRFPVLNKKNELVGMITNRDITTRLLREANNLILELEDKTKIKTQSHTGHTVRQFLVLKLDFEKAGRASTELKKILKDIVPPKALRRIAVASYELEMNIVVHSEGGKMIFKIDDERVEITAIDDGPGIPDVDKALEVGFSTANEWVRSLGFGAGMGLPNVKRVSDEFEIVSKVGKGTRVIAKINLTNEDENGNK